MSATNRTKIMTFLPFHAAVPQRTVLMILKCTRNTSAVRRSLAGAEAFFGQAEPELRWLRLNHFAIFGCKKLPNCSNSLCL
jgi:hypothetical protein